ncbi:hypothetical protein L2E82_24494 [Cichorium intybus]|uniref:Uncharacterized protein n=1 Tax=Cichorium intybus TaxID=13427 RepID=A0ACB9E128_CICIN|nr:hypothetical protein L2E82_24494 [Cichorium intybus]
MASSSRAPVSYATAEGVLAGTILVLCVQIFAVEVVAVEIGVSLLMVFLSVASSFSFDCCLRLRPSSHPISMQTPAIVLTIAAIQVSQLGEIMQGNRNLLRLAI